MMVPKIIDRLLLLVLCFSALSLVGQEKQTVQRTFIETRIVSGQSVETNNEGIAKFLISHRFGRVNSGIGELFGLDISTIRLGLDYGVTDRLTIGLGRSSFQKTVDGLLKYRIADQQIGQGAFPMTITAFADIALVTAPFRLPERDNLFSDRLTYIYQLLLARKINDDLSLQLMPTLTHRNLVPTADEANDVLSLGLAGRYQLSMNWALSFEYYYNLPDQLDSDFKNPLAIGVEWETRGHVFQLQLGNARGMTEKYFITETRGEWAEGDIHFGFNISRDFKLKGRKYR